MQFSRPVWLMNQYCPRRRPSGSLHVQILNKIQMLQLVKTLISTTHVFFQTDQL